MERLDKESENELKVMPDEVILDNFWSTYSQAIFDQNFHQLHLEKLRNHLLWTNIGTTIIILLTTSSLKFPEFIASIWPFIVIAGQAIIIWRDHAKIKECICSLELYLAAIKKITANMETDWVNIQSGYLHYDQIITQKSADYRNRLIEIEQNYIRGFDFKRDTALVEKADEITNKSLSKHNRKG